jgi:hypothetical protein
VRPTKTGRGIAKEIDNFLQNVRVLKVAGMLGGFMKQFMEEQEEMKRGGEEAICSGGEEEPESGD